MLWFYTRDETVLRVETRFDNGTRQYVLVTEWSNDSREEERFETAGAFWKRLLELDAQLDATEWDRKAGPFVLPYGWPDRRPDR